MDWPIPLWRQADRGGWRRGQPEPEMGNGRPREVSSTKLQAGSIANQEFLRFWMVDICQEGCSQRSAPQKRHMAHLRRHAHCTPRKSLTGMGKAVRYTAHLEVTMLVKHLVT